MAISEDEYILIANRVNVSRALQAVRDILPGDKHGITCNDLDEMLSMLREAERYLCDAIEDEMEGGQ